MIYQNNFPEYLQAIAIGPDASFLEKNTTNCELVSAFPLEVDLMYTLKTLKRSSDPLNHIRHLVKKVCIFGPDIDVPCLNFFKHEYKTFPKYYTDIVTKEIGDAFNKAKTHKGGCSLGGDLLGVKIPIKLPIPDDLSFICTLAGLLKSCKSPCNYFKPISDSMGILADFNRGLSSSSNILGDTLSDTLHAPLNIATNIYNKIFPLVRNEFCALKVSGENLLKKGVGPFFPESVQKKIKELCDKGESPDKKLRVGLAGDTHTYHAISVAHSEVVGAIQRHLGDCFRQYDHNYRYNAYDPLMNTSSAKLKLFGLKNGEVSSLIDVNGSSASGQYVSENTFDKSLNTPKDNSYTRYADSPTAKKYDSFVAPSGAAVSVINAGEGSVNQADNTPSNGKVFTFLKGEVKVTNYGYPIPQETTPDSNSEIGMGTAGKLLIVTGGIQSIAIAPETLGMVKYGDVLNITITNEKGEVYKTRKQVNDRSGDSLLKAGKYKFLIDEYTPAGNSQAFIKKLGSDKNLQITIEIADTKQQRAPWSAQGAVAQGAVAFTNKPDWDRALANFKSSDPKLAAAMERDYKKFATWYTG